MFEIIGYDYSVGNYLYYYDTDNNVVDTIDVLNVIDAISRNKTSESSIKLTDGINNIKFTSLQKGVNFVEFSLRYREGVFGDSWTQFYFIYNDCCYDFIYKCLIDTLKTETKFKLLGKNDFDEVEHFIKSLEKIKLCNYRILKDSLVINDERCIFMSFVNLDKLPSLFCDDIFGIPRNINYFMEDFKNYCIRIKERTPCDKQIDSKELILRPVYDYTRNRVISVESYFRQISNSTSSAKIQFYAYSVREDAIYLVIKGVFDWNYGTGYKICKYNLKNGVYKEKLEQLYGFDLDEFIDANDLNVFVRNMEDNNETYSWV